MAGQQLLARRSPRSRKSLNGTGQGDLLLGTTAPGKSYGKENGTASSSSSSSASANDDGANMKMAKERVKNQRRANSVGGAELQSLLKDSRNGLNTTLQVGAMTSRRNAPGPRKSAIRARPQVFESPSAYTRSATQAALAVPNPNPAPEGVAASMLVPARHSNSNSNPNPNPDPNKVQETEAEMRPPSPEEVVTASVSQTQNNSTRASAGSEMMVDVTKTIEIPAEDGGASRKKRRVTFSRRQEKTDFVQDEPTMRIKPAAEQDVLGNDTQLSSEMSFSDESRPRPVRRSSRGSDSDSDDSDSNSEDDTMDMEIVTSSDVGAGPQDMFLGDASNASDMSLAETDAPRSIHHAADVSTEDDEDDSDDQGAPKGNGEEQTETMEFTTALGGLRRRSSAAQLAADAAASGDDATMDFTVARGGIQGRRSSTGRRVSQGESEDESDMSRMSDSFADEICNESGMDFTQAQGGIQNCRSSLGRRSSGRRSDISQASAGEASISMDFTKPLGGLKRKSLPGADDNDNRRSSVGMSTRGRTSLGEQSETIAAPLNIDSAPAASAAEVAEEEFDDSMAVDIPDRSGMEMTVALGGIQEQRAVEEDEHEDEEDESADESRVSKAEEGEGDDMSMEMTVARGCIASPAKSPKIGTPIVQTGKAEPPSPVKRVSASPSKRMDPKSPVRPASPALPGSPRRGHEHCHKPAAESPKAQRPVSPSKPAWGSPAAARAPASPTKLTPAKRRPSAPSTPSTTRVAPSAAGANGPSTPRSAAKAGPATPSRFRQSILGGSPATSYKHSPARRLATPNSVMRTPPPSTPPSRAHLPGLSNSARKASPSPRARALRSAAFRGRKSVGAAVMTGEGGRAFAARRRSSIMAAILPMREDESFDVSTSSANAEDSKLAEQDPSGSGSGGAREGATESAERIQLRLPLSEFLGLVGLKFHDDMSANKRRPTPPALLDLNADNKSEQGKTADTNVMGQVKAEAAAAPMLEALREACRDLQENVHDGLERVREMEEQFYNRPPDFVAEMMSLQLEEERKSMEDQFKLQKQAARASAVHDYYGWRMDKEFDEAIVSQLEQNKAQLSVDAKIVREHGNRLRSTLPALRARHQELAQELRQERERQAAIEACEPGTLKELYEAIDEQNQIVENMRAKHADSDDQLARLRARLDEIEGKKRAASDAIASARAVCQQIQGCTKGEAARLQREIKNVENLHLWRLRKASSATLQLTHDGMLDVCIGLGERGMVSSIETSMARASEAGSVSAFAYQALRKRLNADAPKEVSKALRQIATMWTAARHLQAEVDNLTSHFPLEIKVSEDGSTLAMHATLLMLKLRAKVVVVATCTLDATTGNEKALFSPENVGVELVYGQADAPAMSAQVRDRLTNGSLAQACLETLETFDV